MKTTSTSLLAIAPLLTLTYATGTLQLDIVAKRGFTSPRQLYRRGIGETNITQDAQFTRYYANVTVGTPPQNIQLTVDTGSSDVWLIAKGAEVKPPAWDFPKGTPGGTFDISQSSTASDPYDNGLNITYVDESGASGDLFSDSLTIAGAKLDNYLLGLADKATTGRGILGLGFSDGLSYADADDINADGKKNIVDAMVAAKHISSQAYSLWLNDIDSNSGALLFGGIDTKKYEGDLHNIAMYPTPDSKEIDQFTISFTSLTITLPSGNTTLTPSSMALPAVLDSGATQTVVPDDIAQAIYQATGATYLPAPYNVAVVPCSVRDVDGSFDFGFAGPDGPVIEVPIAQMIYPGKFNGQPQMIPNTTQEACVFGITPASTRGLGAGMPLPFGDTFLRSAYVVYDLANKRIGLAQTKYNVSESEIVKFESQGAQIPRATTVEEERKVTVTAYRTATSFAQKTPDFTGVVGSAFAAAYTGELAIQTGANGTRFSPKPTGASGVKKGDKIESSGEMGPRPMGWVALGWAAAAFAIGGGMLVL